MTSDRVEIVLVALREAERRAGRAVSIEAISEAIPTAARTDLVAKRKSSVRRIVRMILADLVQTGEIPVPTRLGRTNLYRTTLETELPGDPQRASLRAYRAAVRRLGRPVRLSDVLTWWDGASATERGSASPEGLRRDTPHLRRKGDLRTIRRVRGGDGHVHLMLPADMSEATYPDVYPLTRLERVEDHCRQYWAAKLGRARAEQRLPRPWATGEIRAWIERRDPAPGELLVDPQTLVNALRALAAGDQPALRMIRKGSGTGLLWCPSEVQDGQLDIANAYPSDADRLAEAVRRAEVALGHPVPIGAVRAEIATDRHLKPRGQSIRLMLTDITRPTKDARQRRRRAQVRRATVIRNRVYYTVRTSGSEDVIAASLREEWLLLEALLRAERVKDPRLHPALRAGRIRLLRSQVTRWVERAETVESAELNPIRQTAAQILERIAEAEDRLPIVPSIPDAPTEHGAGVTARAILSRFGALWPAVKEIREGRKIIPLIERAVLRIPNPEYRRRSASDPRAAANNLFDRLDLYALAANRWGGPRCLGLAVVAEANLGRLRDDRFLAPLFVSGSPDDRAVALACGAFLSPSEETTAALTKLAEEDPVSAIRETAAWAVQLHLRAEADDWLAERHETEEEGRVKAFLQRLRAADHVERWRI